MVALSPRFNVVVLSSPRVEDVSIVLRDVAVIVVPPLNVRSPLFAIVNLVVPPYEAVNIS